MMAALQQVQPPKAPALARKSFFTGSPRTLQRKCACGDSIGSAGECEECAKKRGSLQRAMRNNELGSRGDSLVPPIVHEVLRSRGRPLDLATRAFMEPRFGHNFGNVRVHTDARAAESTRAVNALAYTVGQDVVFREGHYAPETTVGKELLAHELTHAVQQSGRSALALCGLQMGGVSTVPNGRPATFRGRWLLAIKHASNSKRICLCRARGLGQRRPRSIGWSPCWRGHRIIDRRPDWRACWAVWRRARRRLDRRVRRRRLAASCRIAAPVWCPHGSYPTASSLSVAGCGSAGNRGRNHDDRPAAE